MDIRRGFIRFGRLALVLAGLGGSAGISAQEAVEFIGSAPKVVAVGEAFRLSYTVNAKADNFNGPKIENFLFSGPMLSTSMSTQIINSQVIQSASYTYNYTLQASQEGTFTIPPATVTVKGRNYSSEALRIEVLKGKTDPAQSQAGQTGTTQEGVAAEDLFVRVELDRNQVYKGEHIVATIKIYTRVNLARFGEMKMPSFSGFWSQEIPTSGQVTLERTNYNGQLYNMGVIRRTILVPQQTGSIRIEPFELECFVNVPRKRSRSPFDDFFSDGFFGSYETLAKKLVSPATEVRIKPFPVTPPQGFAGAVGRFSVSATLDKSAVKTNEAVNLKVVVRGNGNLKLIDLPSFRFPADLEVYDPKVTDQIETGLNGISGSKTFEYLIIPRFAGTFEIPNWSFTWFDPAAAEFRTYTTEPMKIEVQKGEQDAEGTVMTMAGRENIRLIGQDVRFIKTGDIRIRPAGQAFYGSKGFIFGYVISLLLFILTILLLHYRHKSLADAEGNRYRRASGVTRKRLAMARSHLARHDHEQVLESLLKAVWGYIGDKLNMDQSRLNRENIREMLEGKGISAETVQELEGLLDAIEFLRYAPGQVEGDYEALVSRTSDLILTIEKTYRRS
ncbi:MAG: BatD family protein [Bacteroidales bacterium]